MTSGPPDQERERIRGYLLAQGERYSWLELWPRVVRARVELLDAIADVTAEQAAFSPGEGQWSIAEVAHHVLNGAHGVARIVDHLARGEAPPPHERTDPQREPAQAPFGELRRDLTLQSAEFAGLAANLPEPPSLEGTYPHMFFGELHCRAWYLFQRIHDQDHAGQIAAVKAAPGYPDA